MTRKKEDSYGLVVPGCLLAGMGFGFLLNQVPAGLFIGLGTGLLLLAFLKSKR